MALCALRSSIRVGTFCQDQLGKTKVDVMKSRYVWFGGQTGKDKTQLSDIKPPVGRKKMKHLGYEHAGGKATDEALQRDRRLQKQQQERGGDLKNNSAFTQRNVSRKEDK